MGIMLPKIYVVVSYFEENEHEKTYSVINDKKNYKSAIGFDYSSGCSNLNCNEQQTNGYYTYPDKTIHFEIYETDCNINNLISDIDSLSDLHMIKMAVNAGRKRIYHNMSKEDLIEKIMKMEKSHDKK